MTRGRGVLVAAAFATTATWPSSTPGRSTNSAWGFRAAAPRSANCLAVNKRSDSCRSRLCGSWSAADAAASTRQQSRGSAYTAQCLHANAAFKESSVYPSLDARRGRGGVASFFASRWCSSSSSSSSSRPRLLPLPSRATGGDGGDGGLGGIGLDAESVARAREAAKKDDYDWFMEFIGVDEEGEDGGSKSGGEDNSGGKAPDGPSSKNGGGVVGGASSGTRRAPSSTSGRYSSSGGDYDNGFDNEIAGGPPPRRRGRRPAPGRGFQPRSGGVGATGGMGRERRTSSADTAYDYDLDEEYDQEPGRGGWDYDPGLSAGIGARRRDVQVDKVRAKTKSASMRRPLEDDQEPTERRTAEQERRQEFAGGAMDFEPVGSKKAKALSEDLGYTEAEVACIDPDMADLAIERAIRRPASGMPRDWVAVGMPPPPPPLPTSTAPAPSSSQTYFGGGAAAAAEDTGRNSRGSGGRADVVDDGSLDLDAILGDGYDYDGGGGRRRKGTRRNRSRGTADDWRDQERRRGGDDYYYDDDEGARQMDRMGIYDREEDFVDAFPRGRGEGRGRGRREMDRGMGGPRGQSRRPRRKKKPGITPAEQYERQVFGDLGGEDGRSAGNRRPLWDEENEEDGGKLWTGVGPDGPWPTMEEFTKLLREETEVRLSLVGPWAAEVVALENRFRLQAYEKWLEVLDKGIGETLEEAGVFDAAFTDDDEYDDDGNIDGRGRATRRRSGTNNLYDDYTSYGYGEDGDARGGGKTGYDVQDQRDERGFDFDDRFEGGEGNRRQRQRRQRGWDEDRGPSRRKFDVGSFLRSGPLNIMQPGAGMEQKAAQFERRYPGRTGSSYDDADDNAASAGSPGGRNNGDDSFGRRGRTRLEEDYDYDDGVRGRRRGRGGDRGGSSPGYLDEDEYDY
ncbi:unnamed protein product [Ectocarpus fasciculatus]